jgi:predicted Rossmann fold nucleotide-binding protein DprA/Smf involved in DNA uptake
MTLAIAGRSRTVRTPANEDAIIAAVEREPRSSRDIARELGQSQPRIVEVLIDHQLNPFHYSRNVDLLPNGRPLHLKYM